MEDRAPRRKSKERLRLFLYLLQSKEVVSPLGEVVKSGSTINTGDKLAHSPLYQLVSAFANTTEATLEKEEGYFTVQYNYTIAGEAASTRLEFYLEQALTRKASVVILVNNCGDRSVVSENTKTMVSAIKDVNGNLGVIFASLYDKNGHAGLKIEDMLRVAKKHSTIEHTLSFTDYTGDEALRIIHEAVLSRVAPLSRKLLRSAIEQKDTTVFDASNMNITAPSLEAFLNRTSSRTEALKAMETVDLSNNLLSELPRQLLELCNLKQLNVANNVIAVLPNKITESLSSLETLDVSNNQLYMLPEVLVDAVAKSKIVVTAAGNPFPPSMATAASEGPGALKSFLGRGPPAFAPPPTPGEDASEAQKKKEKMQKLMAARAALLGGAPPSGAADGHQSSPGGATTAVPVSSPPSIAPPSRPPPSGAPPARPPSSAPPPAPMERKAFSSDGTNTNEGGNVPAPAGSSGGPPPSTPFAPRDGFALEQPATSQQHSGSASGEGGTSTTSVVGSGGRPPSVPPTAPPPRDGPAVVTEAGTSSAPVATDSGTAGSSSSSSSSSSSYGSDGSSSSGEDTSSDSEENNDPPFASPSGRKASVDLPPLPVRDRPSFIRPGLGAGLVKEPSLADSLLAQAKAEHGQNQRGRRVTMMEGMKKAHTMSGQDVELRKERRRERRERREKDKAKGNERNKGSERGKSDSRKIKRKHTRTKSSDIKPAQEIQKQPVSANALGTPPLLPKDRPPPATPPQQISRSGGTPTTKAAFVTSAPAPAGRGAPAQQPKRNALTALTDLSSSAVSKYASQQKNLSKQPREDEEGILIALIEVDAAAAQAEIETLSPKQWSVATVQQYLVQNRLATYKERFAGNHIDGEVLLSLTEQEMIKYLGINDAASKTRLLNLIKLLRDSQNGGGRGRGRGRGSARGKAGSIRGGRGRAGFMGSASQGAIPVLQGGADAISPGRGRARGRGRGRGLSQSQRLRSPQKGGLRGGPGRAPPPGLRGSPARGAIRGSMRGRGAMRGRGVDLNAVLAQQIAARGRGMPGTGAAPGGSGSPQ